MAEFSLKLLFLKFELEICNISFKCVFFNFECAEAYFFNSLKLMSMLTCWTTIVWCDLMYKDECVDSGRSCGIINPREAVEQRSAAWAGSGVGWVAQRRALVANINLVPSRGKYHNPRLQFLQNNPSTDFSSSLPHTPSIPLPSHLSLSCSFAAAAVT